MTGLEPALYGFAIRRLAIRHTPTLNWSEYEGSNLGPPGPKPGALPGCAILRVFYFTLGS